jgi:hypothetical protein
MTDAETEMREMLEDPLRQIKIFHPLFTNMTTGFTLNGLSIREVGIYGSLYAQELYGDPDEVRAARRLGKELESTIKSRGKS